MIGLQPPEFQIFIPACPSRRRGKVTIFCRTCGSSSRRNNICFRVSYCSALGSRLQFWFGSPLHQCVRSSLSRASHYCPELVASLGILVPFVGIRITPRIPSNAAFGHDGAGGLHQICPFFI